MVLTFAANYFFHVDVIWLIIAAAVLGAILTLIRQRKKGVAK